MSHEIICAWLGLPADAWPPDHYRLLGLEAGEDDVSLIEQRVHQRLDSVRRYQMMHPEQATEAMNHLAQAFVCLTEPGSKKAYDASLLGGRTRAPAPVLAAPRPPEPPRDPLSWMYAPVPAPSPEALVLTPPELPPPRATGSGGVRPLPPARTPPQGRLHTPPPVRVPPPLPAAPPPEAPEPAAEVDAIARPAESPAGPPPDPIEPLVEAARSSPQARRGLATKRALYRRVAHTRELLHLWHRVGKLLDPPEQRLTRQQAAELLRLLGEVEESLDGFPALFGEAGQPGYMLLALAQLDNARATVQNLAPDQRASLYRDWKDCLKLLNAHRDFLRLQVRAMRRRGLPARLVFAVRAFLNEQPVAALVVLLALVALGIAVWRSHI